MEGLLGMLVGIVVLLSTLTNLFKKFTTDIEGNLENDSDRERQEIDRRIEESLQGLLRGDQEETKNRAETGDEETIDTEVKPTAEKLATEAGVLANKQNQSMESRQKRISRSEKNNKKTVSNRKAFTEEELIRGKRDLMRGIILKEVLDRPRSQRPYRPPYQR